MILPVAGGQVGAASNAVAGANPEQQQQQQHQEPLLPAIATVEVQACQMWPARSTTLAGVGVVGGTPGAATDNRRQPPANGPGTLVAMRAVVNGEVFVGSLTPASALPGVEAVRLELLLQQRQVGCTACSVVAPLSRVCELGSAHMCTCSFRLCLWLGFGFSIMTVTCVWWWWGGHRSPHRLTHTTNKHCFFACAPQSCPTGAACALCRLGAGPSAGRLANGLGPLIHTSVTIRATPGMMGTLAASRAVAKPSESHPGPTAAHTTAPGTTTLSLAAVTEAGPTVSQQELVEEQEGPRAPAPALDLGASTTCQTSLNPDASADAASIQPREQRGVQVLQRVESQQAGNCTVKAPDGQVKPPAPDSNESAPPPDAMVKTEDKERDVPHQMSQPDATQPTAFAAGTDGKRGAAAAVAGSASAPTPQPALPPGCVSHTMWLHLQCAAWCPEARVVDRPTGRVVVGLAGALKRAHRMRCCSCGRTGASLTCASAGCGAAYHLPCAQAVGCTFQVTTA